MGQRIIEAEIKKMYTKLVSPEAKKANLINGYILVNERYAEASVSTSALAVEASIDAAAAPPGSATMAAADALCLSKALSDSVKKTRQSR